MEKGKGKVQLAWREIIFGAGIGTITLLVLAALVTWLISMEIIDCEWMDELSALTLVLSGVLTGIVGKGNGALNSFVAGGIVMMALAVISTVLFGIELLGVLSVAVAVMGGCGVSVLLSCSGRSRKPWKKYGYR